MNGSRGFHCGGSVFVNFDALSRGLVQRYHGPLTKINLNIFFTYIYGLIGEIAKSRREIKYMNMILT